MSEREEILKRMEILRIHARGASKQEKARLNRDYKELFERLNAIDSLLASTESKGAA